MHAKTPAALVVAIVSMTGLACSKDLEVSASIRELIREQGTETIRLADATRFEWDRAYLFDPYTPRSTVCDTLSIQAKYCDRSIPFESQDDGDMSIAFLAHGRLVHYARHRRANGDFTPAPAGQPLSPTTAVFRVVREDPSGRYDRVKLIPR